MGNELTPPPESIFPWRNNADEEERDISVDKRMGLLETKWIPQNNEFSVFIHDSSECDGNWKECIPIKRLLAALDCYSSAKEDIFCNFVDEIYNVQLLEDYSHFLCFHDDDLYHVNQTLKQDENTCCIKTCSFASRHHRNKIDQAKKFENGKYEFYAETMDSLHYHLMHLFESGMRVHQKEQTVDKRLDHDNSEYFDAVFARMIQTVSDRRKNTQNFNRFKSTSKYNLCDVNEHVSSTTFLDELNKKLSSKMFLSVVEEERFETDSIQIDINIQGNLYKILTEENKIEIIKQFIAMINMQNNTFSIGYRFFYWEKYKGKKREKTRGSNFIDYGGYQPKDLFVMQKYNDFKMEILIYKGITMEIYQQIIIKANEYLQTANVKGICAQCSDWTSLSKQYNIYRNSSLNLWNLIALILYTDHSELSTEFSASFRKLSPFESLKTTKERNRNFWWMAKTLRETVEVFGKSRRDGISDSSKGMFGPFYTGVNRKMIISQFNIRLNAPTSTTKEIAVALRFGGDDGTIIQLNNSSNDVIDDLRGFDVSWLSKFKEENESVGGFHTMRVESIRLIKTNQNFEKLITPLYYLDAMLTGNQFELCKMEIDKNAKKVIEHLFKYKLTQKKNVKMDEYIYECFDAFVKNKQSLIISLDNLVNAEDFMRELIVHTIEEDVDYTEIEVIDKRNMIRSELISIFTNVKNVIIYASGYPFSLSEFLALFRVSAWNKVTIKGFWISHLWNDLTHRFCLLQRCNEHDIDNVRYYPDQGEFNLPSLVFGKSN